MKWKTEETISIAKWKDGNHFQCYYDSKILRKGSRRLLPLYRKYVENINAITILKTWDRVFAILKTLEHWDYRGRLYRKYVENINAITILKSWERDSAILKSWKRDSTTIGDDCVEYM